MKKLKSFLNSRKNLIWVGVALVALALVIILIVVAGNGNEEPEETKHLVVTAETDSNGESVVSSDPSTPASDSQENPSQSSALIDANGETVTLPTISDEYSFEKQLAAASFYAISMYYPNFELTGFYTASTTTMDDRASSEGCYVLFRCDGQEILLQIRPLDAERTERGTLDLYHPNWGYASFDEVPVDSVSLDSMQQFAPNDLQEILSVSGTLLQIIEH